MKKIRWWPVPGFAALLALASLAYGQARPYIGFVYPAGGRQGPTFQVKLGGQGLDGVCQVLVTGTGVTARVVDYYRKLGPQETTLLREQLVDLKRELQEGGGPAEKDEERKALVAKIQKRLDAYVNQPACASLSTLVFVEVTIEADAEPGARELRLATPTGVSNPLAFHVGQLPEFSRQPLPTCNFQVLGKEELALRKRSPEDVERRVTLPCVANGQIAPGERNVYRFEARKGRKLVFSVAARQLVPYLADAVPGWFQPVIAVCDAGGKELAYNDDFRFKPDPTLSLEVPRDGEYVFTITDAIFRGREDFVYRVTMGELPFVTSIFPLGGRAGAPGKIEMKGWNLEKAELLPPPANAGPGVHLIAAAGGDFVSNRVPFALDTLPESLDREPNDAPSAAQKVRLPVIVNGRMDRAKDEDVFLVEGRAGEMIVAEVTARRLDSPMDSLLRVTDSAGRLLAFNDDCHDPAAGTNTHHADSYLMVKLPADGICFVHLTDTARQGGQEYAYRLRLGPPQPDFSLRVVPSSVTLRGRGGATLTLYALRRDGFAGDIKLGLKDPPEGFSSTPVVLKAGQDMARLPVRASVKDPKPPVNLVAEGRARIGDRDVVHEAVPAEDRMQAFLWRHLVPAEDLKALVYDPSHKPPPRRVPPPPQEKPAPAAQAAPAPGMQDMMQEMNPAAPAAGKQEKPVPAAPSRPVAGKQEKPVPATPAAGKQEKPATPAPDKTKFTKQQVAGRLRQLKILYEDWLLTDEFYARKVAECEALQ